ncbi:hypothetical protein Tco_0789535 [Tanacetum coccineum]
MVAAMAGVRHCFGIRRPEPPYLAVFHTGRLLKKCLRKNDQLNNGESMRKKSFFLQQSEDCYTSFNRGLKRCASRSTLHPFMNALEKDMIGELRRMLQAD